MLTLFFKFHIMYYTIFIKNFQIGLVVLWETIYFTQKEMSKEEITENLKEVLANRLGEKLSFKKRKENTLASLNEVENFLFNYKHFMKYVKLYKFFRP